MNRVRLAVAITLLFAPFARGFQSPAGAEFENALPRDYPAFLTEVHRLTLRSPGSALPTLLEAARQNAGADAYEEFLKRFGIREGDSRDVELEVRAQIERLGRRSALRDFAKAFDAHPDGRLRLVAQSEAGGQLEYALRQAPAAQFEILLEAVMSKDGFGPQSPSDRELLDHLLEGWRTGVDRDDTETARLRQAVIAQLASQRTGSTGRRLPFGKWEIFAMLRNAERTLEQRRSPYLDISPPAALDDALNELALRVREDLIDRPDAPRPSAVLFDRDLVSELTRLRTVHEEILARKDTGQSALTRNSVRGKLRLLQSLETAGAVAFADSAAATQALRGFIDTVLSRVNQPHRARFIHGIILEGADQAASYRLIEEFPMIVAGATYPYQWKHDNEVNIALLLANVDPYLAAQAVRFIVHHYMWKSQRAKEIGLYGWIPQIVFADRQNGKQPQLDGKISYYFPDFRFRPTEEVDAEKERNRTSEIMQLPFFGWTVWRVYQEMRKLDEAEALAFLEEVYPYLKANTEAIRTALDPFGEGVLSGRDAWVNGMDNAWYHLDVMARHLPNRLIPNWAMEVVGDNRVDNRVAKTPGNPVDPGLAKGRPTEEYYAFKIAFYDILRDLRLEPLPVYHATPYNAKDVAITAVMARSLEAQIEMAEALRDSLPDARRMRSPRAVETEPITDWQTEISRLRGYLDLLKTAVNEHLWSETDQAYYNRDVTQFFSSVVQQRFCRAQIDADGATSCRPRLEFWRYQPDSKQYRLNRKAADSLGLDRERVSQIRLDADGRLRGDWNPETDYWTRTLNAQGEESFELSVDPRDPFIVEQFCRSWLDRFGNLRYEPDWRYWSRIQSGDGSIVLRLNETAKNAMGRGARRLSEGDLLGSPAIAGFFPLFGHIPDAGRAARLARQIVDPRAWWPVDGIPLPTQPIQVRGEDGGYLRNPVYDADRYWLGPTWMASNKPVMDGLRDYGYETVYLYLVQRTAATLQDGRAVEHWNPETGEVNTSNVNFPWAASGMAGSIWEEMTEELRREYLQRFHPPKRREMGRRESPEGGLARAA